MPFVSLIVILGAIFYIQPRSMSTFGLDLLLRLAVPLAFATMVAVSRLTRSTIPTDVARVFARMHLPERLGMGIERLPRG